MFNRNNATSNPPNTTQTEDGCVVASRPGELGRCAHQDGRSVPQHIEARNGVAGHQRGR